MWKEKSGNQLDKIKNEESFKNLDEIAWKVWYVYILLEYHMNHQKSSIKNNSNVYIFKYLNFYKFLNFNWVTPKIQYYSLKGRLVKDVQIQDKSTLSWV